MLPQNEVLRNPWLVNLFCSIVRYYHSLLLRVQGNVRICFCSPLPRPLQRRVLQESMMQGLQPLLQCNTCGALFMMTVVVVCSAHVHTTRETTSDTHSSIVRHQETISPKHACVIPGNQPRVPFPHLQFAIWRVFDTRQPQQARWHCHRHLHIRSVGCSATWPVSGVAGL